MKQVRFNDGSFILTTAKEIEDFAASLRFSGSNRAYVVSHDKNSQRHMGSVINSYCRTILNDAQFCALFDVSEKDILKTSNPNVMEYLISVGLANEGHRSKKENQLYTMAMARALIFKLVTTQNKLDWRRIGEWLDPLIEQGKEVYTYPSFVDFEILDVSKKAKKVDESKKLSLFKKKVKEE